MVERIEADKFSKKISTKVWNIHVFFRQQRLPQEEEKRLTSLFGDFATDSELLHNVKREPRWRY
ncbi:hypothetical protein CN187_30180 [Sinorhizobium meliloti]|nr:hypothetical protein [Sinorhizobium meliloti]RVI61349.1 hypothetical protein CN187_30180 [Sinorhizobium meliloti]